LSKHLPRTTWLAWLIYFPLWGQVRR